MHIWVCTVGSNSRSPELEGVGLEVHALVRVTGPWLELPELVDTDTQGLVMYLARIHNLLLLSLLLSKKLTVGGHSVKAKPKRKSPATVEEEGRNDNLSFHAMYYV